MVASVLVHPLIALAIIIIKVRQLTAIIVKVMNVPISRIPPCVVL
jgi:hypothetical protein